MVYATWYAFNLSYRLPYMKWDIQHIFLTLPISTVTIMSVFLSPEFRAIEYFIIAIILIFVTLFSIKKKYPLPDALKKGIVATFFTSALVYAVYADIGWTKWLVTDFINYWGLSTEEKLIKTEDKFFQTDDGLYEFALQAKKIVDDDYQIYSPHDYAMRRTQYFLLPFNRREKAPYMREKATYIIIMGDAEAKYDPLLRVFTRGETTITNVDLVFVFAQNAYILKRL
jgi:hypothetical protein